MHNTPLAQREVSALNANCAHPNPAPPSLLSSPALPGVNEKRDARSELSRALARTAAVLLWWASLHNRRPVPVWGGPVGWLFHSIKFGRIDAPRSWLKRQGGAARALWYSLRDVALHEIRRVVTFGELSRSPVEEGPAPRLVLAG